MLSSRELRSSCAPASRVLPSGSASVLGLSRSNMSAEAVPVVSLASTIKNASVDNRIQTAILARRSVTLRINGYFQTPGFTLRLRIPIPGSGQKCTAVYTRYVPEMALPAIPPAPSPAMSNSH